MTPQDQDKVRRLTSALLDKTGGDAERDELESMLRSDQEARRYYLQLVNVEARLATPSHQHQPINRHHADREDTINHLRFWEHARTAIIAVAACVLLFTGLAVWNPGWMDSTRPDHVDQPPVASQQIIAGRISGCVDARWNDTALPIGFGSSLLKGQLLELVDGRAEITFARGAVVTISGPATLVIDSDSCCSLRRGTLSASVPEEAIGFAVLTPTSQLIDFGTDFGVSVAPDGAEEIHVFKGVVEASIDGTHNAPAMRLRDGQAIRLDHPTQSTFESLPTSRPDRFPSKIDRLGDSKIGEPLPPDRRPPVTQGLTLWLSADGATQRDQDDRVQVWGDMLAGDNRIAQNATQHEADQCPQWVENAIAGKPAIRFDGNDVLMLPTPMSLGILNEPYEMFVVAQSSSPRIQFLIAGGYEAFEIHVNGEAGARFIPIEHHRGDGSSDLGTATQFTDGRPHIFAGRMPIELDHHGVMVVDGVISDDPTYRDARNMDNTPLRLGSRIRGNYGLIGDIAEILIYRGVLTDYERTMISQYLNTKYDIQPDRPTVAEQVARMDHGD